jgi:hypothetical protein
LVIQAGIFFLLRIFTRGGTRRDGWGRERLARFLMGSQRFHFFFGWNQFGVMLLRNWMRSLRLSNSFCPAWEEPSHAERDKGSILFVLGIVTSVSTLWIAWRDCWGYLLSQISLLTGWTLVIYRERWNWSVLLWMRSL